MGAVVVRTPGSSERAKRCRHQADPPLYGMHRGGPEPRQLDVRPGATGDASPADAPGRPRALSALRLASDHPASK
jgi:hypothetical protein